MYARSVFPASIKVVKYSREGRKKEIYWCPPPCGTIAAKDELIWLHVEEPFLPHVFDVIESLVFAKAIVLLSLSFPSLTFSCPLPLSPPSHWQSRAALYREKLIFPSVEAIPRLARRNKSNKAYNSNLNRVQTWVPISLLAIKDEFIRRMFVEQLTLVLRIVRKLAAAFFNV